MKEVLSFINSLGENYYLSLLIQSDAEIIDFNKYDLKIYYNNNFYYELSINEIHLKRREIVNNLRSMYLKAISEIYINLSTKDPEQLETFLHFNIEATKFKLKTIKSDFYIDSNLSRYNSAIDTDNKILNILAIYIFKHSKEPDFEIDKEILSVIKDTQINSSEAKYLFKYFYDRFEAISFLPLALFNIGYQFFLDLRKIKHMVEEIKAGNLLNSKIKWSTTKTHIGFIIGTLAHHEYIEPPRNKNGEINYTAFAKLIKQNFEIEISDDTLRKYLNPNDDKYIESKKIFEQEKFYLPHSKLTS